MNKRPDYRLLPAGFERPYWLFWLFVLPQAALLLVHYSQWWLIEGEMDEMQRHYAMLLGGFLVALIALNTAWMGVLRIRRYAIPASGCVVALVAHIVYLWMVTVWMNRILPPSVLSWILPESEYFFYPFALVMPALMYCGIRIAAVSLSVSRGGDIGISAATLVVIPAAWFLVLQAFASRPGLPQIVVMVLFVGSTTLVLLVFIRLLLHIHLWLGNRPWTAWVLPALAGLAAPIGGLLLNRAIPFPYDFQAPVIYVLAVVNGLLLMLPPAMDKTGWWRFALRALSYPFTLYFFIVFLPFLPLSLLAMIVAGAGFLILAPSFLFIIHTRRLVDDASRLALSLGRLPTWLLFLSAVAILPLLLGGGAQRDRMQLDAALSYAWAPDDTQARASFRPEPVLRALDRIRDRKAGIYLPFLSEAYDRIVFDGMTLPERKLDKLEHLLSGSIDTERKRTDRTFFFGMRDGQVRPMPRNVELTDLHVDSTAEDGFVRARVTLQLTNRGPMNSEFVAAIHLPEGVLVTDYWLDVDGTRAPGRIFEKKAAMWVYHMIRDVTRQDPGLLIYESPTRLRLRVFPFNASQVRETGWECLFPAGMQPHMRVGDRVVPLHRDDTTPEPLWVADESFTALVTPALPEEWKPVQRQPYAHLILDASAHSGDYLATWPEQLPSRLAAVAPDLPTVMITLANYESVDVTIEPQPMDRLPDLLRGIDAHQLPKRGGLDVERVIRRVVRERERAPDSALRVPIFFVIPAQATNLVFMDEARITEDAMADTAGYYVWHGDAWKLRTFNTREETAVEHIEPPAPVHVVRGHDRAVTIRADALSAWHFWEGRPVLERYDADRAQFTPLGLERREADTQYGRGLMLWAAWYATHREPAREVGLRARLIEEARELRTLFPLASFIVVESEAQWRTLEKSEREALGARRGLEFDEFVEAPEPAVWLLIPVWWWLLRRRRRA